MLARRRIRHARVTVVTFVAVLVAGCGGGGGVDEQLDTLQSWRETLQLAAALHARDAVTDRALAQLRDGAREAIAQAHQQLAQSAKTAQDSARVRAGADSLAATLAQLDTASRGAAR